MKKIIILIFATFNFALGQSNKKTVIEECKTSVPNCDLIVPLIKNNYQNILTNRVNGFLKKISKHEFDDNFYILESYISDVGNYYLDLIYIESNKIGIKSYCKKGKKLRRIKTTSHLSNLSTQTFLKYIKERENKPCELSSLNGKVTKVTHFLNGKCHSFIHF